jgi:DedD protein
VAEPRTHYQVSFTSKQAVLLFAGVLVALAVAYLLGVATGLAGREPAEKSAAAPTPVPSPAAVAALRKTPAERASSGAPAAATKVPARASPAPVTAAAREPAPVPTLQFFEEEPEKAAQATPGPGGKAAASEKASGSFWVQVVSTSSQREAESRRALLVKHGHHATVSQARGAKGGDLYRVRVGPYASREEASRASEELVRKEKVKTWIVPPGE